MADKIFISKLIKDDVWIFKDNKNIQVSFKGKIRLNNIDVAVGDYVSLTNINNCYIIDKILDRKNFLLRPKVANVDKVLIIQSAIEPNFNSLLLDKMITFYEMKNIPIAIAISKLDLVDDNHYVNKFIEEYISQGYDVYKLNHDQDFKKMLHDFDEQTICFVGNSGVGKSSLINRIDPKLNLNTQVISKTLNRGKHTTTNVSIVSIKNFFLIDTPGFSTINVNEDKFTLAHYFFKNILKDKWCKFSDCLHNCEIDCLVKKYVLEKKITINRYNNYLNILKNIRQ